MNHFRIVILFLSISLTTAQTTIPDSSIYAHKIRPANGRQIGQRLKIAGLVSVSAGISLIGLGALIVSNTPSEIFPSHGIVLGITGLSCLTISIPLFTTGVIIKRRNTRKLEKIIE